MTGLMDVVTNWLMSTWGITVPNDWLEACVEWIQSENETDMPMSSTDICSMVFEQWLVCDLRTIGASCLPLALASQVKVILSKSCCLQINSMVDVSSPFYEQQQKATGTVNSNVHINASTQSTQQQQSEAKGSRMIVMKLTDGTQDIQAMEYRLIPTLNANLPPGTKIVVHPGALCRSGMLMLAPDNVSVLGGEVETLLAESGLKIIHDSLRHNLELAQRPREQHRSMFNSSGVERGGSRGSQSQVSAVTSLPAARSAVAQATTRHLPPGAAMSQCSSGVRVVSLNSGSHTNVTTRSNQQCEGDGFDDDIADEDLMMIADDDDIDSWTVGGTGSVINRLPDASHNTASSALNRSIANDSVLDDSVFRRPESPLPISYRSIQSDSSSANHRPVLSTNKKRKSEDLSCIVLDDLDFDDDFEPMPSFASQPKTKSSCLTKSGISSSSKDDKVRGSASRTLKSEVSDVRCGTLVKSVDRPGSINQELLMSGDCRPSSKSSSSVESSNPVQSLYKASDSWSDRSFNRPFTYLAEALAKRSFSKSQTVCVKVYVSTLLSRLEHGRGSRWSLTAKINDGTAAVDVQLTDSVLTHLIGFSASECAKMKVAAKSDEVIRSKLEQGLKQCQTKLVQLSSIVELSVTSDPSSLPQVISLRDVNICDVQQLRNLYE